MNERLAKLEQIHAADPSDADVPYMIAQEHAQGGDHAAAIRWYDTAIGTDPEHHYAYFHKARSQEASGDMQGAHATLEEGLGRARTANNAKAAGEIEGYLASLGA